MLNINSSKNEKGINDELKGKTNTYNDENINKIVNREDFDKFLSKNEVLQKLFNENNELEKELNHWKKLNCKLQSFY